jgi:hypothetical protein
MANEAGAGAPNGRDISIPYIDTKVVVKEGDEILLRREAAREWLSYVFAGFFAVTLLGAGIAAFIGDNSWTNVKDLLQILLPAELALLGGAVGFYFGTQQSSNIGP